MVNLELYRTFIAIYREGTISKAAISVDVTQPAASQQLALLEKQLKSKLFERTPRRMVPTDTGHELYTKVADSFDWIDHISQDFIKSESKQTLFTIGVPLEFYHERLVEKVGALPYRCHFVFGTTVELAKLFEEAKLDALVSTHKTTLSGVEHTKIFTEQFWLVAPKDLEIPKAYSRSWLIKQKWIAYDAKLSIIRKYFQRTYQIKPAISPVLISPNLHGVLRAVEKGVGLSVLPDYIVQEAVQKGTVTLLHEPDLPIENTLYFVYKTNRKESLLVCEFLKIV